MTKGFDDIPFFDEEPRRGNPRPPAAASRRAPWPPATRPSDRTMSPGSTEQRRQSRRWKVAGSCSPARTGKTRVLTTRIAHDLRPAAPIPRRSSPVTLHQQGGAGNEGAHRRARRHAVEGMPGSVPSTRSGSKLLRRHADWWFCGPNFTILDTDDVFDLSRQLIRRRVSTTALGQAVRRHDRHLEEQGPGSVANPGRRCPPPLPTARAASFMPPTRTGC